MGPAFAASNLVCAVICAKWALDLGYTQFRQILFLFGGLLLGPLMLLILYTRLVYKARLEGQRSGDIL